MIELISNGMLQQRVFKFWNMKVGPSHVLVAISIQVSFIREPFPMTVDWAMDNRNGKGMEFMQTQAFDSLIHDDGSEIY